MSRKINAPQNLKQLQTQLGKAQADLQAAKQEQQEASRKVTRCHEIVESLKKQIDTLPKEGLVVSEHAMLRYFERVLGYDLSDIRTKIITPQTEEATKVVGSSGLFPCDGGKVRLKGGVAVTVIAEDQ